MFTLQFETDNAAFIDYPATEAARILREVAQAIEGGALDLSIRDVNGNKIGVFHLDVA